jgi:hypothetical protein
VAITGYKEVLQRGVLVVEKVARPRGQVKRVASPRGRFPRQRLTVLPLRVRQSRKCKSPASAYPEESAGHMDDDMHPLPQRPRRAFGAQARAPSGSSKGLAAEHVEVRTAQIPSIHNASGQVGCGRGAQISEEGRSDGGVDGSGSHVSKGIADGCGYDEAVQYVGEGGDRPLAEGELRKYEVLRLLALLVQKYKY